MVLVKKGPFFRLFGFGNIGKESVFYDILKLKKVLPAYKKKKG